MKKALSFVVLICILAALILLSACSASSPELHYAALDKKISKTLPDVEKIASDIRSAAPGYTLELYRETLTNYDADARLMPADKSPAEGKVWDKSAKSLSLKYADVLDEFSGEKPLDRLVTRSSSSASENSAIYIVEYRAWFSERIITYQLYRVKGFREDAAVSYRESRFKSGYGGDLTFDWANIAEVSIVTICLTTKKGSLKTLEYFEETLAPSRKNASSGYYGARIKAERYTVRIL